MAASVLWALCYGMLVLYLVLSACLEMRGIAFVQAQGQGPKLV